ncbi:MAG: hypothetical protein HQL91_12885 [Magnetococcales bacterium]|nr:hypothetical protein [Magnetococcales bacterium]
MYSKYVYLAGASAANILADLVAILTGETVVANLSASCDKAQTTILSTIPAGWSLHDGSAGTNAKTIKAPLADDATKFKYVVLDANTAGYIQTKVYETWDATAHTGTNIAYNSNSPSASQQFSTTLAGTVHLFASARFLLLASLYNGIWGSSTATGPSGCLERTRVCPWDTVAAGWPPFAFTNLGNIATDGSGSYPPRLMSRALASITGTNSVLTSYAGFLGTVSTMMASFNAVDQKVPDDVGGSAIPFFPITWMNSTYMPAPYGEISSLCDIWALPQGVAANLDPIQKGGLDYLCLQASGTTKMFALRKG